MCSVCRIYSAKSSIHRNTRKDCDDIFLKFRTRKSFHRQILHYQFRRKEKSREDVIPCWRRSVTRGRPTGFGMWSWMGPGGRFYICWLTSGRSWLHHAIYNRDRRCFRKSVTYTKTQYDQNITFIFQNFKADFYLSTPEIEDENNWMVFF